MKSLIVRRWLFPLHESFRRRPTLAIVDELMRCGDYRPEQLRDLQWQKLSRLLRDAYQDNLYYRQLLDRVGATPEDIRTPADFAQLPILTKEDIRQHGEMLISRKFRSRRGLIANSTSGSTGEPLQFYTTVRREAALNAAKLRGRMWWGMEMGDRELDLWGPGRGRGWKERLLDFRDYCLNIRVVSAYDLSEAAMERTLALLRRWRPKFVYVYPSAFFHFTLYLKDRGVDGREFGPQVVICSAENLYDTQRSLFQEFYGASVVNEYGSHDGGLIAFECPEGRLHVTQEQVYVEMLADGKLIVTDLENYGQPFIRYEIGDYGELSGESCPCGRGLSVLSKIFGRATEMLRSTSGLPVPGLLLTGVFRRVQGIREFQVVQEDHNLLRIRILKDHLVPFNGHEEIKKALGEFLGDQMRMIFEYPDELERKSSGKCSWFVSKIAEEKERAA